MSTTREKCADCGGAGEKPLFTSCHTCDTCGGSGIAPLTRIIDTDPGYAFRDTLKQELARAVANIRPATYSPEELQRAIDGLA